MIVTLVGYRGSGKSSVGPLLADMLGCECVDSDDQIEFKAGKPITEIFSQDGEPAFRQLESEVLNELLSQPTGVIASGGGAILAERNRVKMREAGPVVWLQASAATLATRIGGDETSPSRRPNLTNKSVLDEVSDVLNARAPLYKACSTIQIETEGLEPAEIAKSIFERLFASKSGATS